MICCDVEEGGYWPHDVAAVALGGEAEVLVGGAALAQLLRGRVVSPRILILPFHSRLAVYCVKTFTL